MVPPLSHNVKATVHFHLERGDSNKFIEDATRLSGRQICRMRSNWEHFGGVVRPKLSIGNRPRILSQYHNKQLLSYLEQQPTAYLDEMCWFLFDEFDISVSKSTVCRALQRLSWTRKKAKRIAAQQNQALRDDWMTRLGGWTADQLVFLDKSAACERTGNYFLNALHINADSNPY